MTEVFNSREHPLSRVQELATYLRALAMEKGPEAKLPTARELGRLFGASQNTVSATLDLLQAQHVISRRQGSGIYVSPWIYRKSICILFYSDLFHSGGNSPFWGIFWSLFAEEMERCIASQSTYISFHLVIQSARDECDLPEDVMTMIQLGNVHGVMAVGMDTPTWNWLRAQGIPLVAFAGPGDYSVVLDVCDQIDLGVAQLVKQGCRSIGIWLPTIDTDDPSQVSDMRSTCRAILEAHGVTFDPTLVRWAPSVVGGSRATSQQEQGYHLAHEVFGTTSGPRPDGLFIVIDMLTAGALVAFHRLSVTPGHDLKIATHANKGSSVLFGAEHDLTLVEIDPAEIVQAMFSQMDAVISGQSPPPIVTIKPRLRMIDPL